MARIRERKTRYINQIKCIKYGTDRLLVKDDGIMDRWREYFDKLSAVDKILFLEQWYSVSSKSTIPI